MSDVTPPADVLVPADVAQAAANILSQSGDPIASQIASQLDPTPATPIESLFNLVASEVRTYTPNADNSGAISTAILNIVSSRISELLAPVATQEFLSSVSNFIING